MYYNIADSTQRAELTDLVVRWISDADSEHRTMLAEWNEEDDYFENDQVPEGFSEQHRQLVIDANNPMVGTPTSKQYVVVNKVKETHESVLGIFISAKRNILARGRTPKDARIAKVIGNELRYVEDQNNLWDEVCFPSIDCSIRRGLHWVKVWYNPYVDLPLGKLEATEISCRDVLLDPSSRKPYYQDTKYRIHRQRFEIDVANQRFAKEIGQLNGRLQEKFGPDTEAESPYKSSRVREQKYCTIYEIEYRDQTTIFTFADPNGEDAQEISAEMYNKLASNPETAEYVFQQSAEVYYVAFYNRGVGLFYNAKNKYGTWALIPFINLKSEGRLYPFGDTKFYKNLQDLFNVLISVLLDNAKKGNQGIGAVDLNTYQQFGSEINAAMSKPGFHLIPGLTNVFYPREINQAVINLLGMTEKYIYNLQANNAPSRGELPARQIAQATVEDLIAQDRLSHGRKDIMIRWSMTQLAKLMYRIIVQEFKSLHWAVLMDEVGSPEYIPINGSFTEEEYTQFLQGWGDPDKPVDQKRKEFEKENEVRVQKVLTFLVNGAELTAEEFDDAVLKKGITPEQAAEIFRPEPTTRDEYIVNDITKNPDIDITYEVDFNAQREQQTRQTQAFALNARGYMTGKKLMEVLDYPDADEIYREAEQENKALGLAREIAANPTLMQQVMGVLQGMQQGGPGMAGQGVSSPGKQVSPIVGEQTPSTPPPPPNSGGPNVQMG